MRHFFRFTGYVAIKNTKSSHSFVRLKLLNGTAFLSTDDRLYRDFFFRKILIHYNAPRHCFATSFAIFESLHNFFLKTMEILEFLEH